MHGPRVRIPISRELRPKPIMTDLPSPNLRGPDDNGRSTVMQTDPASAPTFPFDRVSPDLPNVYDALLADEPIARVKLFDGRNAWFVTRHADVKAMANHRAVSADRRRPEFPFVDPGGHVKTPPGDFISMDDPDHARLRRMLTPEFGRQRVESLRPRVETIVDALIDGLLAGPTPVELIEEFALRVPSRMICEVLGVPYADHDFFEQQSKIIASIVVTREQFLAATATLYTFLDELVSRKERQAAPDDDLIGRMVTHQVRPGHLTHDELVAMTRVILHAGHVTTMNMIGLSASALLTDPRWFKVFASEPEEVPLAVEELLRYFGMIAIVARVASEDFVFRGVTIRAGDAILLGLAVANRDDDVFPQPHRLDFEREEARKHLAFGWGVHTCLGAPLAHLEMEVALAGLARRIPTMRLATPVDQLEYRGTMRDFGLARLPVTW
jgi:cytochrome P450